jgi:hypothetical protein
MDLEGEIRRGNFSALAAWRAGAADVEKKVIAGSPGNWFISIKQSPPGLPGDLTYEAYMLGWKERFNDYSVVVP